MTTTAPDTGTTDTTDTTTEGTGTDLAAEVEKWKSLARRHEERAKANAGAVKELEELRSKSMTDQERAVAEAISKARTDTLREVAAKLVAAEIRTAVTGRGVDADALLYGVDHSRFLGDDLEPDTDAIRAWVDRVAPARTEPDRAKQAWPDLGQGARGGQNSMALNGDPLLGALKNKLGIS